MRWTNDQKIAKGLRDLFGAPPDRQAPSDRLYGMFGLWAVTVAEYLERHQEPVPTYGKDYLLAQGGGSRVGTYIGPVPEHEELWVFRMSERGDSLAEPLYREAGRDEILDDYEAWLRDQEGGEDEPVEVDDLDPEREPDEIDLLIHRDLAEPAADGGPTVDIGSLTGYAGSSLADELYRGDPVVFDGDATETAELPDPPESPITLEGDQS